MHTFGLKNTGSVLTFQHRPNCAVKWDVPPYGDFESLFFYQGLAALLMLRERHAPYLNVGRSGMDVLSLLSKSTNI